MSCPSTEKPTPVPSPIGPTPAPTNYPGFEPCMNTIYHNPGPITPVQGALYGHMDMKSSMIFQLDVTIHSWRSDNLWQSIFLVNQDTLPPPQESARYPGIWIRNDSPLGRGFHVFYTDKAPPQIYDGDELKSFCLSGCNGNTGCCDGWFDTLQPLQLETKYTIKIYAGPATIQIGVDDGSGDTIR